MASEPVIIPEPGDAAKQTPGLGIKLGLRLRSRLFRGRSRSSLHRRMRRTRGHCAGSAARGCHRSRAGRRHRSTAGRGRGTAARSRGCRTGRGRSTAGRSRGTRSATTAAAAAAITTATAVVMVVMVVMAAAAAATTAAISTAAAAATTVREQAGGSWAWSGDQERRSGHHGQKQSLAKHQRSPHLLKFLRRVNCVDHLLPQGLDAVCGESRASFKNWLRFAKSRARQSAQSARTVPTQRCENTKTVKALPRTHSK